MIMIVRLNKYISSCGVASRRKSEELIANGRVTVNGDVTYKLGTKINSESDEVSVDGEILRTRNKVYYLLNKPKGVVTTTKDEKKRKTVTDLINTNEKIFPVGRLDYNTTGVLILTNDGEFSNFLTHPKNAIEREYEVLLDKSLSKIDKLKTLTGIYIDNKKGVFKNVSFPKKNNFCLVRVITLEGRNHFVKKMFDMLNYRVQQLDRIRFGKINVRNLQKGEYRLITSPELQRIMNQ